MLRTLPDGNGSICRERASITMRRRASALAGRALEKWKALVGSRSRGTCGGPCRAASTDRKARPCSSWSLRRSFPRSSCSMAFHVATKACSSRSESLAHQFASAPARPQAPRAADALGPSTDSPLRSCGSCSTLLHTRSGMSVSPMPCRNQKSFRPPKRRMPLAAPTKATANCVKNGMEAKQQVAAGSRITARWGTMSQEPSCVSCRCLRRTPPTASLQ
mmetsp:Transcript_64054/g.206336  ORF Transcript_64054/g.206336 Transcript_64054/m.206336 type:complete len:219 (-) Transcript_64054:478-1134(-)